MKKLLTKFGTLAFLVSTMFVITACSSSDDPDKVTASPNSLNFDATGGEQIVSISSNTNWVVSSSESWCHLSTMTGSNDGAITVKADSNNEGTARSCILTIVAGDAQTSVVLNQAAPSLSVTPTDISLLSNSGSSASISITTTGSWSANCNADWLNLSSKSGNGSTNLTVTAVNDNTSAEERSAIVYIQVGAVSQSVSVTQKAKYIKAYVDVDVDNMVTLTKSVAFKQTYRGNVSYYYAAVLAKSSSAGWTDDKVVTEITTKFNAEKPGEGGEDIYGMSDLTANTSYIIFTVAYNEKGEQGPLQRFEMKTARSVNSRPSVTYGSIRYDDDKWYWSTTIGPYAKRYYMIATDDMTAYYYIYYYFDALVAYDIREDANSGTISPIVNSGNWNMSRTPNAKYFYSAAWALDDDGNFAGELDKKGGSISSSARQNTTTVLNKAKYQIVNYKKLRKDLSSVKIFKQTN